MRAGCTMPGMKRALAATRGAPAPGLWRDIAVTAVTVVLTAAIFAAVASSGVLAHIQHVDNAWLLLMTSNRSGPVTALAKFFDLLGLVYVTLPVRIAIAGYAALRRRWWHLAAFAVAIALSEALIGTLKGIYDRARPPGSLVATSGASFPLGRLPSPPPSPWSPRSSPWSRPGDGVPGGARARWPSRP